jgi:hypothetical protein
MLRLKNSFCQSVNASSRPDQRKATSASRPTSRSIQSGRPVVIPWKSAPSDAMRTPWRPFSIAGSETA